MKEYMKKVEIRTKEAYGILRKHKESYACIRTKPHRLIAQIKSLLNIKPERWTLEQLFRFRAEVEAEVNKLENSLGAANQFDFTEIKRLLA